ncbi:MAG: hypothetical protein JXA66_04445 [Oligoflexia bacterium]|nr:hypothetical protein [Oligoflexia bacterium]
MKILEKIARYLNARCPTVSVISYGCEDEAILKHLICSNRKLNIKNISDKHDDSNILIITGYANGSCDEVKSATGKLHPDCIIIGFGTCNCRQCDDMKISIQIPGCPPSVEDLFKAIEDAKNMIRSGERAY